MDHSQEQIGELTSLMEMLTVKKKDKRIDEIIIPKIQRDYAQGRKERGLMRSRFLNRLFKAIDPGQRKEIELDFIYGQKEGTIFYPIDGQQRLTTLFLLYLYIAKRIGEEPDLLEAFSYDTRDSSKEFCLKLLEIKPDNFKGIKHYIENQWWFTHRWKKDPTISSMLVVLGDIDAHYSDFSREELISIWEALTDHNNIKFWQLNMVDLDTTDDLYIKMNSRGKLLTFFEHFKAEIVGYFAKPNELKNPEGDKFALKIDTVWTRLLWQYRNPDFDSDPKKYAANGLDQMFLRLFRRFMIIEDTKNGGRFQDLEKLDILTLAEKTLKNNIERIHRFESVLDYFSALPSLHSFFSSLLTTECEELFIQKGHHLSEDNYKVYLQGQLNGEIDILKRVVIWESLSLPNMLLAEAFFHFAAKVPLISIIDLKERLRMIRNLILNSRDEIRNDRMPALLNRIDAIIEGQPLLENASSEFRQIQIKQEIAKLSYMKDNPDDTLLIKFTENHSVLRGNLNAYIQEEKILTHLLPLHAKLFYYGADYSQIEKYLLTFGDYAPSVGERKLYGGQSWENWRDDIFNHSNTATPPVLHQALQGLTEFNSDTMDAHIKSWIDSCNDKKFYPWRYYLVRHKGTRHGEWARYAQADDFVQYDYIMMNKNNFNGKHWNPYLYCLWRKFKDQGAKLEEYNAPLIFENQEIVVYAYEDKFEIIYPDGHTNILIVPQTSMNGTPVDIVDRIEFTRKELQMILELNNPHVDV